MTTPKDVTFVKNAIHRPDDPRHFMRLKRPKTLVSVTLNGKTIAQSHNALKMQEAGFDLYDPVYYFPKGDVETALLEKTDHTTHCPLKGDTEYFNVNLDNQVFEHAAFCYAYPLEQAEELKDYIAFDQSRVQVVEYVKEAS